MNYYNPYMGYQNAIRPHGIGNLFNRLTSNFSFSGLLNNAQKTLNLVNQAIPLVKQAGPVMKNAKTMFKIMNEFKKIDTPSHEEKTNKKNVEDSFNKNVGPTFFA